MRDMQIDRCMWTEPTERLPRRVEGGSGRSMYGQATQRIRSDHTNLDRSPKQGESVFTSSH